MDDFDARIAKLETALIALHCKHMAAVAVLEQVTAGLLVGERVAGVGDGCPADPPVLRAFCGALEVPEPATPAGHRHVGLQRAGRRFVLDQGVDLFGGCVDF